MKKQKHEIEETIRAILGTDKFLMLNLKLVRELTPDGACFLTYILDKYEYLVKSNLIGEVDGMYVYRREIRNKLGLTDYKQRNIESMLKAKGLLEVIEERVQGETFNKYYPKIVNIWSLVEGETVVV